MTEFNSVIPVRRNTPIPIQNGMKIRIENKGLGVVMEVRIYSEAAA